MKKQIRANVFETNSSSTHSVSINWNENHSNLALSCRDFNDCRCNLDVLRQYGKHHCHSGCHHHKCRFGHRTAQEGGKIAGQLEIPVLTQRQGYSGRAED